MYARTMYVVLGPTQMMYPPSAKFQPYDALRQRFWVQYLRQYDVDDTDTISRVELTSMLDSLGSTLSTQTIDTFFTQHGKRPDDDELTIPEAVYSLELELCRPKSEKKRLNSDDSFPECSSPPTPGSATGGMFDEQQSPGNGHLHGSPSFFLGELDFSGPLLRMLDDAGEGAEAFVTEPSQRPLAQIAEPLSASSSAFGASASGAGTRQNSFASSSETEDVPVTVAEDHFERVINVKNCPLCHRPRMNSKAEMDIVTHLAICASKDWARVDRIVVGNFVTASQAQRKWYTKIITKVSSGNYKLGAVRASLPLSSGGR